MCWRILNGFRCAAQGVWQCMRAEWHFRFHMVAACYVLWFAPRFDLTRAEWSVLALTIGGVLAAELFNSAVERAIDRFSTERHPLAGLAKDMAAGAVLVTAVVAVAVAVFLFWDPPAWLAIIGGWKTNWFEPILLLVSAVLAGLFIGKWGT